ncbi:OmcA/MtrC family decaheme c-type cytochrome [Shewanella gelidimarina]|uniref:OmcA/MtrC family decaheme c-type cytochrome n=1 Tax=Shewanella gelidimarina TaxID=56813 RepID=UPI00200BD1A3|nr:OmcA/MtrC family decaheme c-type cytochrome [Shewanella gelidimarina]MCL1058953.1 OmcA/MtrC family decaheme c-type cytochrome [Shewanella gelidimarina]
MMNVNKSKIALLLAASAVSMALTGCGGDDGTDGNPGNPGGPAADYINTLNLKVTDVTYTDGVPTINVFASNEEDLPVVGLKALEVKNVDQLIPQGATGAGNSAQWQRIGNQKEFTDLKNGNYTFTIEVKGYNAELTQRYNVIASASTLQDGVTSVPRTELSQDFSGEGYEPLYTKNIVSQQTCAKCHAEGEPLTRRHSTYINQETCATCHVPGSYGMPEEKEWNHLIHNIHNTNKIFESRGYVFDGKKAEALIQNNCKSCHVEPEADSGELTEWGNWSRIPTMETCTSCHTGIDFVAGKGHSQQADNSNCVACHSASWTAELHTSGFGDTKALIDTYGMNTALVVNQDTTATVTVSLVNANGEAVNATTLLPQIQRIEATTNVGPNNVKLGYYGKDSLNLVLNGELNAAATITETGAISYTTKALTFGDAGADADTAFTFTGLALCSESGQFVNCDTVAVDGNLDDTGHLLNDFFTGMKADLAFATLSGEAVSMRHVDSVNFSACASCHSEEFQVHKGSHHPGFVMSEQLSHEKDANDQPIIGVDACVACHTPDGTYAGGVNKGALEMKLHKTHSQGDYAVIPGMNCDQCHNDFNLDAFKKKGALATSSGKYTTPIAATCVSCHSYNMDSFKAHVEGQGALVDVSKVEATDAAQLETCFYCHAPTPSDHTQVKM